MKKIYSLFLRSTIMVSAMMATTNYIFSQSGVKWATNLNSCSGTDAFGTSNYFSVVFKTNNTAHMWLTPSGNLGLGISNPVYKFDVNGRAHYSGNVIADSSITAMNLYAIQKVSADALQVNNLAVFGNEIIVDGNNSSITTSAASLSFGSNNLQTSGNINGNIINANDFNASGNITGNIFTANAVKVSGLGGSGTRLITADNTGNLAPFSFSGNSSEVLYGNGVWKALPRQSPWLADSIGIYPDSTLTNTNVFVKSLNASNSVSIGTFRFKNGLPGERDTISAEKRITIYAPSRIELNSDTLTMKNRVGIGVANPQSALDVAGDINTSGTVYASNLYAQNSVSIGTLKISNGAPGSGKDSISSPYKLALVSAGREISLLSDTVKIGDYNSTVRFDVNGSVRVRDMLWVEDGIIVGQKFEGEKAKIDTVTAKKVEAGNLKADTITTSISKTDTAITQKLIVEGNARISNTLKIGNTIQIDSLAGVGFKTDSLSANSYKLIFADQNGNLVTKIYDSGLGSSPAPCTTESQFAWLIGGNTISHGQPNFIGTCNAHPFRIYTNGLERMRITETGNVGIGTTSPVQKLEVKGSISVYDGGSGNNNGNNSLFFGREQTTLQTPATNFGEWGIQYWFGGLTSDGGTGTGVGGLNFWKPWGSDAGNAYHIGDPNFGSVNNYLFLADNGNVGIGTNDPQNKLDVCGTIRSIEWIVQAPWWDSKFETDYKQMTWQEKLEYIQLNKHLPQIDNGEDIEKNGLQAGKTMSGMIWNIEDNTLDIIDLYKENQLQKEKIENLQIKIEELTKQIETLINQ